MTTKITPEFLQLDEQPMVDTSVDSVEFYEIKLANPDTDRNPRFSVDYTDQWVLPNEAFIQMTGEIVKAADDSSYAAAANVAFVNNGPLHLFERAIYKIDKQAVETVEKPGEASLVTPLVDYSDDYVNSMGEQLMIAKDTVNNDTENTNTGFVKQKAHKKFDLCIPLSHIFGIARGVNKVFYGMTHTVEFQNATSQDNALFRKNDVDAAKVKLTGLSLWMPRVNPSPESSAKLLKFISDKSKMQAPFQQVKYFDKAFDNNTDITWDITQFSKTDRPRHVFVSFRLRDKEGNQEQNNALFDPCTVTDISLTVNGEIHPRFPYSVDFANKQVGRPYRDLLSYRGIDNKYDTGMLITKSDFLSRYPVYHFDLERMPEPINDSATTLQLRARLNAGGNYRVHVTMLSDRDLTFTGDGKKMNVNLR